MSTTREPWWASGDAPEDVGTDDPLAAHQAARAGRDWRDALAEDIADAARDPAEPTQDAPHWLGDAMDVLGRMAADATQRLSSAGSATDEDLGARDPVDDHPAGRRRARRAPGDGGGVPPHAPGEVCNACPVCLGLRALRAVRPEVIGHLSDAAHHLSLALRAVADAAVDEPDHVERITLDDD